tara:strand:+ start:180 stop:386 length:207 start_codon:yes stop_codon:yes gene_type:complete
MSSVTNKSELRDKLKSKLEEQKITRSSKFSKEIILKESLKKMGIDRDKLKKDMIEVNKKGGLSFNLNK